MSKIVLSLSSNSLGKAIDKYHDPSSFNGSSDSSNSSTSSGGNTTDEYVSGVSGVPLEIPQGLKTRSESGSQVGTSAPSSVVQDEVEVVYSCAIGIESKTDDRRLDLLKKWYQIPDDLKPRLAVRGEWCCQPHFGIGIYEAYLLGGFRLSLNAFARELLTRLGIGVCQLNPNAWRLIVSMQVLWREVFEGNCPLIVDELLYYYKPSEINQSLGFYQFTARGKDYRLTKSIVSSDRNWKTKFFFVSSFWAGRPLEVSQDPFPPYTGELGNLHPKGMLMVVVSFCIVFTFVDGCLIFFFGTGARRPHLGRFYIKRIQKVRLHTDRAFHSLLSLQRLATWGLGPNPSIEALAHELTIRRRKLT